MCGPVTNAPIRRNFTGLHLNCIRLTPLNPCSTSSKPSAIAPLDDLLTLAENPTRPLPVRLRLRTKIGGLRKMWMWLNDPALPINTPSEKRLTSTGIGLPRSLESTSCLAVFTGISGGTRCRRRLRPAHVLHHGYLPPILRHRSYSVGRVTQFVMAVGLYRRSTGRCVAYREHHLTSDTPADPHSPLQHGFLHSHGGCHQRLFVTPAHRVRDWYRFPELVWLERFEWCPLHSAHCVSGWESGRNLRSSTGHDGPQLSWWVFFGLPSRCTTAPTRPIPRPQYGSSFRHDGRQCNNGWVAFLTLGRAANNHHRFPVSARHGLSRWELDPTWWGLKTLSRLGIVRDLRVVPESVMEAIRLGKQQ